MLKNITNIVLSVISNILNINANNNKIKNKYNNLFSNAQIIEEWLNKNSLMRHEYKNHDGLGRTLDRHDRIHVQHRASQA